MGLGKAQSRTRRRQKQTLGNQEGKGTSPWVQSPGKFVVARVGIAFSLDTTAMVFLTISEGSRAIEDMGNERPGL